MFAPNAAYADSKQEHFLVDQMIPSNRKRL